MSDIPKAERYYWDWYFRARKGDFEALGKPLPEFPEEDEEIYMTCTVCGERKRAKKFVSDSRLKHGRRSRCRACHRIIERARLTAGNEAASQARKQITQEARESWEAKERAKLRAKLQKQGGPPVPGRRYQTRKQCIICLNMLPIEQFNSDRRAKDGLLSRCHKCDNHLRHIRSHQGNAAARKEQEEIRERAHRSDPLYSSVKKCCLCEFYLEITEFAKSNKSKDGLLGECRACRSRVASAYGRTRNRDAARRERERIRAEAKRDTNRKLT